MKKRTFIEKLLGVNKPPRHNKMKKEYPRQTEHEEDNTHNSEMEDVQEKAVIQPLDLSVDVINKKEQVIVKAALPGIPYGDIDVELTSEYITINADSGSEYIEKGDAYYTRELSWGSYYRHIVLPCEIKVEESQAECKDGMLTLTLPKIDKNRKTKLKVQRA